MADAARQLALWEAHRAGDPRALNELAESVAGLARWAAGKYNRRGVDREDLVGEAWVGFMDAVRTYDPARGPFASHCGTWMRSRVSRAVTRGMGSRGARAAFWGYARAEGALIAAGREPTDEAVASHLGVKVEHVERARSVEVPLGGREPAPAPDLDEELDGAAARVRLAAAVGRLPEKMRFVVECALEGKDAAAALGVSRQRVQQIRAEAIARLREEVVK